MRDKAVKHGKEQQIGKWSIILDICNMTPVIRVIDSETAQEHYRMLILSNWGTALDTAWKQAVEMVNYWNKQKEVENGALLYHG